MSSTCKYSVKRRRSNITEICNKECPPGSDRCQVHTTESLSKKRNDTQTRRELVKNLQNGRLSGNPIKPVYSLMSQVAEVDPLLDEYIAADKKLDELKIELNKTIDHRGGLHRLMLIDRDEVIDEIILRIKNHSNYMDALEDKLNPRMNQLEKTTGAHKINKHHKRQQTQYTRVNNHTSISQI